MMTYYVSALTNDKAKLIVHEMRTTDRRVAAMVAEMYEMDGLIVIQRSEG